MANNNGDDLDRLIILANKVAKPYLITVWILAVLKGTGADKTKDNRSITKEKTRGHKIRTT